jgi:1A family penicillin-binding protein
MSHKRSYGYTGKDKKPERQKITHGRTDDNDQLWMKLLLIPLKIVWYLLTLIWAVVSVLTKKAIGASGKSKAEVRRRLVWGSISAVAFLFVFGTISIAWMSKDLPDPDRLTDRKVAESTKIYDRTGEHLLYEIFTDQRRTIIGFDEIPKDLINAVIATEDTKFYEHKGIRPLSIARAVVFGVFTSRRIAGTSTLTQQLVKNAILTNERSVVRKVKEAILSIRLEQKYTKNQILKIYFNEIPYGSTNYGVAAAAQNYFGKTVDELELHEIAALAGMPKAPSTYLRKATALEARKDFVLKRMFDEGFITEQQKNEAQEKEVNLEERFDNITAPHFVLHVKDQLVEMLGEIAVNTEGLRVLTTLDWDQQQAAETAVEEVGTKVLEAANANNTALVAMNPDNGNITAMVGSADFFNDDIDGKFNVATLGKRQPGSSFKPIVFTAAFEKGYTPETVLFDVVTDFAVSGKSYKPLNYNLKELGPVTMRQALQGSLNIPSVKALYLVGDKKGVDFAERLGYTTLGDGDFGLSLVLGGGEVKLLEHVAAYGVFANEGIKQEPVSILRIEDKKGDVLYKWKEKRGERVLEKEITATISNVLADDGARAYAFGAGGILTVPGHQVAAKTGTTNGYIDAWTVGYTPNLVAGVWAGNTDNTKMKAGFGGSKVAAPIWNSFMREALKTVPQKGFAAAPENDAKKAVLRGSAGGNITLKINKTSGRRATSSTPEHLIAERTYIQGHSILHYVKKNDPRGGNPNPEDDAQYQIWEDAINDWIARKKEEEPDWDVSFEEPPTEEDDQFSMELLPTLELVFPQKEQIISNRQIDTDIRVTAPRGVTKVSYKIDDKWVGVVRSHPFNLNYYATGLENGKHTLVILVEDDIGNRLEETVPFVLAAEEEKPTVVWNVPSTEINQKDFPRTLTLDPVRADKIKKVTVFAETSGRSKEAIFDTTNLSNLFNGQILVKWNGTPDRRVWKLTTQVETTDGLVLLGGEITIEVK